MKIILLTTPWNHSNITVKLLHAKKHSFLRKILRIKSQSITGAFPPLGLMYVSSVLKKYGHEVIVKDGFFENEKTILSEIKLQNSDIIGLSINTSGWKNDQLLIKKIKKLFPNKIIIVGGSHANAWRENCLKDCKEIDFLVYGDAEFVFPKLVRTLEKKTSISDIKGVIWKDKSGQIINNGEIEFTTNLDTLPFPDWDCVDIKKYVPALTNYKRIPTIQIIGSRGCPFNCVFCHSSKTVRKRSAKNILSEINTLVSKYGIKDVTFYDETFTMFKKRNDKLCDELIKNNYKLTWAANARPEGLDKKTLLKIKKSGCWKLLFGVESGSQRILDSMKKDLTTNQIKKAIKLTKECGIETHGTMIFGMPGETYQDGLKSIEFTKEINLDYASFGSLAPLPGTKIYDTIKNESNLNFEEMSMLKVGYVPESMTKQEMEQLMAKSFKSFYLRPKYILKRLLKTRDLDELKKNLVALLGFI